MIQNCLMAQLTEAAAKKERMQKKLKKYKDAFDKRGTQFTVINKPVNILFSHCHSWLDKT